MWMWVFRGGRCFSDFEREVIETSCEQPSINHFKVWVLLRIVLKLTFSQVPDVYQKHVDQGNTCLIEITVNCCTLFEVSNEVLLMVETEIQILGVCFCLFWVWFWGGWVVVVVLWWDWRVVGVHPLPPHLLRATVWFCVIWTLSLFEVSAYC